MNYSILLLAAFMGFQKSMEIPTDEEITTVRIVAVDEEGRPLKGVPVEVPDVICKASPLGDKPVRGKTDARGEFVVQGRVGGSSCCLYPETDHEMTLDFDPWRSEAVVTGVVCRIKRRVPMCEYSAGIRFGGNPEFVDYDLLLGSPLPPHGNGKVADMRVSVEKNAAAGAKWMDTDFTSTLTMHQPGGGFWLQDRFRRKYDWAMRTYVPTTAQFQQSLSFVSCFGRPWKAPPESRQYIIFKVCRPIGGKTRSFVGRWTGVSIGDNRDGNLVLSFFADVNVQDGDNCLVSNDRMKPFQFERDWLSKLEQEEQK